MTNMVQILTVTAYAATGHLTADGHLPKAGITCAASRNVPFGTKLSIEGVGVFTVQDRLARRYDDRVDLFMDSKELALHFGKHRLKVMIFQRK